MVYFFVLFPKASEPSLNFGLNFRAQNNFRTAARHDDRPNKFFLGQVFFLAGQKYWEKSQPILS